MTRRRAARRRSKRPARLRIGRFWILIVVVASVLIAIGGFAEFWPGFYPQRVMVTGNARVDRAAILQAAGIARHRSIWLQSIRAMASRIAAIPFVGRATVRRYPPGTIAIGISERVPFAIVQRDDDEALVDVDLRVLQVGAAPSGLPVFVLAGAQPLTTGAFLHSNDALELRAAYDMLDAAALVPARLQFDRYGQLEATTTRGLHLLLGEPANLEEKVRLCSAILAQGQRRLPLTIDVRAPSTPVVTYAVRR